MRILQREEYLRVLDGTRCAYHDAYRALYASDWDGLVLDPVLMRIPVDDHMVHRGDGVFEMCKCVDGGIYNLGAHLQRLAHSRQALGLSLPVADDALPGMICRTVQATGLRDAAIRVYVSRGPGSFGVSPADCPRPHLYIAVSTLSPGFMETHPTGASVGISRIPMKPDLFATLKHCNYLPNVMMKQEALAQGRDFVVGCDPEGYLGEGPTENFGIVTRDGRLLFPQTDRVLAGTTMVRVLELASALVGAGQICSAGYGRVTAHDVAAAAEVMIVGTTTDVTHVRAFAEHEWPEMGPVTAALRAALLADVRSNPAKRTICGEA